MKRDTLLGYGFLLVGLGAAYFLALLLGRTAGTIIAIVVGLSGIGFLAFGHTQSGDSVVTSSDMQKALRIVVPSLEIGLAILGVLFIGRTISSLSQDALTVPTVLAKYKPPKPPPIEREGVRSRQILGLTVPPPTVQPVVRIGGKVERTSQIDITDIRAIDLVSSKYPGQLGLSFNVFFANRGNSVATEVTHNCVLIPSDHTLSPQEEAQFSSTTSKFGTDPNSLSELQPGESPKHYFSCPDDDNNIGVVGGYKTEVLAGSVKLYLFVTVKHRNKYLAPDQIAVTDFCGYFLSSFQMWHECHIGRSYLQTMQK
jgi:hypothetical protein